MKCHHNRRLSIALSSLFLCIWKQQLSHSLACIANSHIAHQALRIHNITVFSSSSPLLFCLSPFIHSFTVYVQRVACMARGICLYIFHFDLFLLAWPRHWLEIPDVGVSSAKSCCCYDADDVVIVTTCTHTHTLARIFGISELCAGSHSFVCCYFHGDSHRYNHITSEPPISIYVSILHSLDCRHRNARKKKTKGEKMRSSAFNSLRQVVHTVHSTHSTQ